MFLHPLSLVTCQSTCGAVCAPPHPFHCHGGSHSSASRCKMNSRPGLSRHLLKYFLNRAWTCQPGFVTYASGDQFWPKKLQSFYSTYAPASLPSDQTCIFFFPLEMTMRSLR